MMPMPAEPPFHPHLGLEVQRKEGGVAEVALDLGPQHLNRRGVAHGGVITALLDSALGTAVVSAIPAAWWCATTSLHTQFLRGPGPGRLVGHGRVVRRGRHVAFAAGEVRDAAGRLVATAEGTWHLWDHRPGAPDPAPRAGRVRLGEDWIRVGKILCVGRNYAAHAAEMGASTAGPPVLFLKPASALVSTPADPLRLPAGRGQVHHEVELVALIGASARGVATDRALAHVSGFAVGLDLTLRDVQSAAKRQGEPWTLAKGFDGAAPVSAFVPRAAVGDGSGLAISLAVADVVRQRSTTSLMLRGVAELVAYASEWMTLEPGDLLFTGTPEGVGPLVPGDRVRATIERVGEIELTIAGD